MYERSGSFNQPSTLTGVGTQETIAGRLDALGKHAYEILSQVTAVDSWLNGERPQQPAGNAPMPVPNGSRERLGQLEETLREVSTKLTALLAAL